MKCKKNVNTDDLHSTLYTPTPFSCEYYYCFEKKNVYKLEGIFLGFSYNIDYRLHISTELFMWFTVKTRILALKHYLPPTRRYV